MPNHYPLTHAQRGVFAECMRYPESQHYGLPMIARLDKKVDAERLVACMEKVINTFSNYNIRLVWVDGEIRQTLRDKRDFRITRVRCTDSEVEDYIQHILRPFDIFNEQLVRVILLETESEIVVLQNSHHLVTDGITLTPLFTGTLSKLYNEGIEPTEEYSIFDYALAQEAYDNSPAHENTAEYYKEHFAGKTFHPLPKRGKFKIKNEILKDEPQNKQTRTESQKLKTENPKLKAEEATAFSPLGRALLVCYDIPRAEIDAFAREQAVRPGFLLEAAYNITLSSFTRSDSVAYLTLQHGRYSRQARLAHGMFIATIPVGIDIDADMPAIDFVRHFKGEMMGTVRRADFSLMDFLRIVGELPDTMYAYQGPKMLEKIDFGGEEYTINQIRIAENTTASFSVVVYETNDAYQLRLECSDAYMDSKMLHSFGSSMKACVESIITNPDAPIRDIQVVEPELGEELKIKNEKLKASPQNKQPKTENQKLKTENTILSLLKESDKTAVVAPNGSLTYSDLTAGAKAVACHLVAEGVKKGDFVAVQTDRSYEFVVAVMGIMMAGAAYVPIDSSYPQDRKDYMMKDSGAAINLSTELVSLWMREGYEELKIKNEKLKAEPAYMIYTSGSTGKPKGVVISHAALISFVDAITKVLSISNEDRISCHSSFSFDASVEDIFPILKAGGTLYIVPEHLRRDLPGLAEWLNKNKITGGNYTTRFGQLLLAAADLPHLRYLVVGGEKMTAWPERNRHLRLFNTYGPTECTVDATYYELTAETDVSNIPIGTPLPGVSASVRDHHGRLLPFGIEGELWLSGTQLADGYWQREEITSRSFVTVNGERLYRTGDIVRWNEKNLLEYLRRDDGQVKLNGYRIELADIEAQLLNHPHILEAKTLVVKNATDILCAYYTCDNVINEEELRTFLIERLPAYMVPSAFVRLEQMPVNVVGKLDVSQLPAPKISVSETHSVMTDNNCPSTREEQVLLDIVRRVTGFTDISTSTPLLEMGITSMQLIQMAMEADKEGIRIKMESLTETTSIRDIASATNGDTFCWINDSKTDDINIVFCGTTSMQQMKTFLKTKREKCSVLLFQPISVEEAEKGLETIVRNAIETIREQIGERKVHAFIGHSFGGEIAYRVAKEWSLTTGETPKLIMLDTTLRLPDAKDFMPTDDAEKYIEYIPEEKRIFWKEYYRKALLASRLHDESQLSGYKGDIILYNALQRDKMFLHLLSKESEQQQKWADEIHEQAMANSSHWQAVHPDITIIDVNTDHYGIISNG